MPGSIVNLVTPGTPFPTPVVVDTNLIVERLIVPFLGGVSQPVAVGAQRAGQFFQGLAAIGGTGIVTPTAYNEFIHVAIKMKYRQEALARRPIYGKTLTWSELYKQDATILQAFGADLDLLRQLLIASGLLFLTPDQLGPITSGRAYDEELVHLVGAYGLDSNDALILMEAQRYGVTDIVTLDADMQRANADFGIYTWI